MSPAEKKTKVARQSIRQPKRSGMRQPTRQPIIVKTIEMSGRAKSSFPISCYVIGYVVCGTKHIWTGGNFLTEAPAGRIYFLNKGTHEFSSEPDSKRPFEQIEFYFTPEQMGRIIANLSIEHNIDTSVRHTCDKCHAKDFLIQPGWDALKHFFAATSKHLDDGFYSYDQVAELLALTQLVYHIVSRSEGCLRTRMLGSTDPEKELMERQIHEYVFQGITLEEFARQNNRSLTSFKKKFKKYFNESPHRWVVRQRLMHSRLQLISTNKSVAQIGVECCFPNTSHFIKLFGKEFGMTPAQYRRRYAGDGG